MQLDFTKPPELDDPATYNRHFIRYLAGLVQSAIGEPTHIANSWVYCSPGITDFQTPDTLLKDGYWVICLVIDYESDKATVWFEAPEDDSRAQFLMKLNNDTWSDFVGWVSMVAGYVREHYKQPMWGMR